jgi:cytochrome P450
MADTATALKSYNDIPVLDWDMQNPEASSYNLFKDLRAQTPLVKVPMGMGSLVLALRARMVDQIVSPENTRQLETEMKMMQGIFDGPIFDFVAQVMLFANGDVHQRRRQPVARTFAFKLMEAMRPKAAAIGSLRAATQITASDWMGCRPKTSAAAKARSTPSHPRSRWKASTTAIPCQSRLWAWAPTEDSPKSARSTARLTRKSGR